MRGIRIGLNLLPDGGLDDLLARIREAEAQGFQSVGVPNIFGFDALTLLALAGRETRRIELATAVVPTHSRHPYYMAQQALSTQVAAGGRFVLGLGPSHKVVIENMLGLSYAKPARHVREYVTIVKALLDSGKVDFEGEVYHVKATLQVAGAKPVPVLIGALGPLMRRIAGAVADGTMTWMAGPRTLGEAIVPEIRAAAHEAGRPAPRVLAGFPVCVTEDPEGARELASKLYSVYGTLPSYRAVLDAEGAKRPGDLALVGDERELERSLARLASLGVTDFGAAIFPFGGDRAESIRRTTQALAALARA
jgi:F420-dependent oxidoreductase-like protein